MSAESRTPSELYTLDQHWNDVSMWWYDVKGRLDQDVIFFVAYERWLNKRGLISVENGHVFDSYFPDPVLDHPGRVTRDRSAYSDKPAHPPADPSYLT